MKALCGEKDVDTVYLDYSRAFDRVDIGLLLAKMKRYGVHSQIVEWMESFLTDRKQKVVLDGSQSEIATIISGVPQGSVLAPLLFLIFINDLEGVVKDAILSFFADDSRAAMEISAETDMVKLQQDLDRVMLWSRTNNILLYIMQIHPFGSHHIHIPLVVDRLPDQITLEDLIPLNQASDHIIGI